MKMGITYASGTVRAEDHMLDGFGHRLHHPILLDRRPLFGIPGLDAKVHPASRHTVGQHGRFDGSGGLVSAFASLEWHTGTQVVPGAGKFSQD